MNPNIIECKDLSFSYENGEEILKNISFQARPGETIGLIGANGVGKSTLLRILVGLELYYTGDAAIEGLRVEKKNLPAIREKCGYVFQDSENQLFMSTVKEDVAFAPRNYGFSESEVEDRVNKALEMIGISHLRDKQIWKMSGGEKKMAAIATILSMTPDIIIMDEPSIALDPKNRRRLIQIINELNKLKIIASHDLDMIFETCDRVILMSEGKIIRDGLTKDILTDKELLENNGLELPQIIKR